jgi:hypothetical protein
MVLKGYEGPDVAMLAAVIARSQIIVAQENKCLPPGYDEVDVAILEWIVAEGRRTGRALVRM